jgi:ribonucleoside-triphosphate reductase
MNGTGVGYSVEPRYVHQLPTVAERFVQTSSTIVVEDSREGWARALRELLALLYTGHVSVLDTGAAQLGGAHCAPLSGGSPGAVQLHPSAGLCSCTPAQLS